MISTLVFTPTSRPIKLPAITEGFGNGIQLTVWVRRTGGGSRQRIIDLGTAAGLHLVLGTGDLDDSLAIGIEQGTDRKEVVAEGALPLNRWVKVTALASSIGIANLSVFDIHLETGIIGTFESQPFTECSIAGGAAGRPFVGMLSGLEINQLPPIGFYITPPPATRLSFYPLDKVTYSKSEQTAAGEVKYYSVDDQGPKNRDGLCEGERKTAQFASPLGGSTVPVLEFSGVGKPLKLSPLIGLSGSLTLETWFCPTTNSSAQAMITLADDAGTMLSLTSSGGPNGGGSVELVLIRDGNVVSLCRSAYGEPVGTFQHVAVTISRGTLPNSPSVPVTMSLYLNGQFITSQTVTISAGALLMGIGSGLQYRPLLKLLSSAVVPSVRLGGSISPMQGFAGKLSEVRFWRTCRSAQEIATRFLTRLVGNESGLLGCYRLEQAVNGCVFDISSQRGLGTVMFGTTIGSATNLPLLRTSDPSAPHINVKGKLLREYLVYTLPSTTLSTTTTTTSPFGSITIPGITIGGGQRSEQVTVFDATLEPVTPDGRSLFGQQLQICPDGDVQVFLEQESNVCKLVQWNARQTYSVTVPISGKVRLRFQAKDLSCPTLRVRFSAMTEGLWTLVRPDSEALVSLAKTSGSGLLTPAPGKVSPLPAGASAEEANVCASTLQTIGRCYKPVPFTIPPIQGEARGILGDLEDAWNETTDWVEDTTSSIGSTLQTAGSSAGKYAEAFVDDGKTVLSGAQSVIKTVGSLVSTASSDLNDLIAATAKAVPRFGKAQLAQCIASADRLAVISSSAAHEISHTFSVIGTSIVDGVTIAWRVVAAGVQDAIATAVEFIKKIGATIKKFIDYLAWLFNWGDFLAASDRIYTAIDDGMKEVPAMITGLSKYKSTLSKYLTIPADIGSKSLAEHCGISVPDNVGAEELEYVTEIAQKLLSATNFKMDGMLEKAESLSSIKPTIDTALLQSRSESLSSSSMDSPFSNPLTLLTTPVSGLLNKMVTGSSQTTVVDFLFEQLSAVSSTMLSAGQSLLTGRISVPNMTGWIEDTILGGRTLNLQRIVSLVGGIAQVLSTKIAKSVKAGSASPQPVSFAGSSDEPWLIWTNFALGVALALLQIPRAMIELAESKAGNTDEAAKASAIPKAWWDTGIGVVCMLRAAFSYPTNADLPLEVQEIMGMQAACEGMAGAFLPVVAWLKVYFTMDSDFGPNWVKFVKVLDLLGQFVLTGGAILMSMMAGSTKGAFQTATDKAGFALQSGSYVLMQATLFATACIDFNPKGKLRPEVPVGLAVAAAVCDLGSGINNIIEVV